METRNLDQRIHEDLLGHCWHEWVADPFPGTTVAICRRCHESVDYMPAPNPAYSIDGNAMLSLIEAMREKRYDYECSFEICSGKRFWFVSIRETAEDIGEAEADTLPLAVALAADKVREMEVENEDS